MRTVILCATFALIAVGLVSWNDRKAQQAANMAAIVDHAGPFGQALADNPNGQTIADLAAIGRELRNSN